ncbi:MAG TPA: ComF family protein [Bacteroidales bacterium]|nr:ComF family protein [Bacteroidales bacterium]
MSIENYHINLLAQYKVLFMPAQIISLLDDFLSLIYPRLCYACGNSLYLNEAVICNHCLATLPLTYSHLSKDNPVARTFWGRIPVEAAAARYYFRKGGPVQRLLHNLKYNHAPEIGKFIGLIYGRELLESEVFRSVDLIIPVPLHFEKLKKRGYNQSAMFGQGLSSSMKIPIDDESLFRTYFTETQTRKSREKRWENVKSVFALKENVSLRGKHILIVDDVITTGSTIEACANRLLEMEGVRISVAAIAFPSHIF